MSAPQQVADGVWMLRTVLVNVFFVRLDDGGWMLVDTGIPGSAGGIRAAAAELFGPAPPRGIVLTHGHFDHVGSLQRLLEEWDVPVYAHPFELPHLNGRMAYPPPDPTVGGGLLARTSFLFPRGPYDVGPRLLALPPDGHVPIAPEWSALHTPGHTIGHVSLFRERDRLLIAGDAVTTTQQESLWAVATQKRDMNGPPAYFTQDWEAAKASVRRLAGLPIDTLASGHGQPMEGEAMRRDLQDLAQRFDERARPAHGRYVGHPALPEPATQPAVARASGRLTPAAAILAGAGAALLLEYLSGGLRPQQGRLR